VRPAIEGTLVTASADDPAIDWEASGTTAEDWVLSDPDDEPTPKLKPLTGKTITEFRYRLLDDIEYTEMLQYIPRDKDDSSRMMLLAIKVYGACVTEVKRGSGVLDKHDDVSRKHKYSVGLRVWRSSQLSENTRDF
jgi:hypothetical protein